MVEPVTWLALQMVEAMVREITVANGYHTDIGLGLVTLDTRQEVEGDQLRTTIAATAVPINESASGPRTVKSDMDFVIEVSVPFTSDEIPELVAHRARADVIRALRGDFRGGAIGVNSLHVTGARLGTPDDGAAAVIAQVSARAGLTESKPPAT